MNIMTTFTRFSARFLIFGLVIALEVTRMVFTAKALMILVTKKHAILHNHFFTPSPLATRRGFLLDQKGQSSIDGCCFSPLQVKSFPVIDLSANKSAASACCASPSSTFIGVALSAYLSFPFCRSAQFWRTVPSSASHAELRL